MNSGIRAGRSHSMLGALSRKSAEPPSKLITMSTLEAFQLLPVVHSFRPVLSLETWNDKVLAGVNDGSLVVFSRVPSPSGAPGPRWEVSELLKGFGSKYVSQLQVVTGGSALLSVCEEGVNMHRLPSFKLCCQAGRTPYAARFTWDEQRAMLAVAVKRRLLLFHYDGREFVWLKDISVPDSAVQMAWAGDCVVVGFQKKEYSLVHANTGAVYDLFGSGKASPCILQLPGSRQLLLTRDNVGIFLSEEGKPARRSGVTWSGPPLALAYSDPYCCAVLPQYIEVRPLTLGSSYGVAQLLPGGTGMDVVAPTQARDGSLFVASAAGAGIYQLQPVSYMEQAERLAHAGDFPQALDVAGLIPDDDGDGGAPVRREVQDRLHVRYGHALFCSGEIDDAMAQLAMARACGPVLLLGLFPGLMPQRLLEGLPRPYPDLELPPPPELAPGAREHALGLLLPYLLSHRSRILEADKRRFERQQQQQEAMAVVAASSSSRPGAGAGAGQLYGADGDGGDVGNADSNSTLPSTSAQYSALGPEERGRMAVLVDTAILKVMLVMSDTGACLRFCQRPNWVDLEEGGACLRGEGRYSELVALYRQRGQHELALESLKALSCHPEGLTVAPTGAAADLKGLPGVWAAVQYVAACPPGELGLSLVRAHAGWILDADPEAGLEMFVQTRPPMPPAEVLPVLAAAAPRLQAPFLEAALGRGYASPRDFHTQLVLLYLRQSLEEEDGEKRRLGQAEEDKGEQQLGGGGRHAGGRQHQQQPDEQDAIGSSSISSGGSGSTIAAATPDAAGEVRGSNRGDGSGDGRNKEVEGRDGNAVAAAAAASTEAAGGIGRGGGGGGGGGGGVQHVVPSAQEPMPRLRELIQDSPYIDASYLLTKAPQDRLLEVRALLLERLGRHMDALRLYVCRMSDPEGAERYCDRVYRRLVAPHEKASSTPPSTPAAVVPTPYPSIVTAPAMVGSAPSPQGRRQPLPSAASPPAAPASASGDGSDMRGRGGSVAVSEGDSSRRGEEALPYDIYIKLIEVLIEHEQQASDASAPSTPSTSTTGTTTAAASPSALVPPSSSARRSCWPAVSRLLQRKARLLDPLCVLRLLPADLELHDALPFLSGAVTQLAERRRQARVVASLSRGENLQVHESLVAAKRRSHVVNSERACSICHKRIGGSVLVAYPGGQLAHYSCYKRSAATAATMAAD